MIVINVKMPENCHECGALGINDIVGLECDEYSFTDRPDGCPLINAKNEISKFEEGDDEMADIAHIKAMFTDSERYKLSDILQNYYCEGLKEIAEEDETMKSIMQKVGLINE